MACICTKKIQCKQCEHYRLDEEQGRMACFLEQDQRTGSVHLDQQKEDYPIILNTSLGRVFVSKKDDRIIIELGLPNEYPGLKMPLVVFRQKKTGDYADPALFAEIYDNGESDNYTSEGIFCCSDVDSFFTRKAKEKKMSDAKAAKRQILINHGIDINHVDDIMEEFERLTKIEKGEE